MKAQRIRWNSLILEACVIAGIALALALILNALIRTAYLSLFETRAIALGELAAGNPDVVRAVENEDGAALQALADRWSAAMPGQFVVLDGDLNPVVFSGAATVDASSAGASIEVHQAQTQGYGRSVRRANEDGARTLFLAFPVRSGDRTVGFLRWSHSRSAQAVGLQTLLLAVDATIAAAALALIGVAALAHRRRDGLIRRLTAMVQSALYLDFEGHILTSEGGDLGELTTATNRLVDKYRKATRRRAREKDRLTTILTHMSNGAILISETGRVRLINDAAAEILETTSERATGQTFVQAVRDHRVYAVLQRCRATASEETEAIELSPERFLRVTVTPFLGGEAGGYLVILEDLSTVRRLEKVRRDFVSNVSHELRTPLASLNALVDTLRDGALDDPPAAQRFLDRIEVEVDKMTQMVQELLELSRIESGQAPLRLSSVTVVQIVRPSVERLLAQAERAGVALTVEAPDDLPRVSADLERMQQVVINLVHNAIKFTPSGGSVCVSAAVDANAPDYVVLSVRDSGVGIPRAEQPRIFERFYKADRSRSGGGTGLGLAIAKHTVQIHGGSIWVESTENQGSTFSFTLHVDSAASDSTPTTAGEQATPPR